MFIINPTIGKYEFINLNEQYETLLKIQVLYTQVYDVALLVFQCNPV